MNPDHLALLRALDAHVTSHSRGTLLEHLRGTHDLLREWGNGPEVCVAGLFHSIYGTYAFETRSADLGMRDAVARVIGEPAERLVHLFCVTDRRRFYDHLGEARFALHDMVEDRELPVDRATLAALIEMEVANVVDQLPRRSPRKARAAVELYGPAFERAEDYMSAGAARAARACFRSVLHRSSLTPTPSP